MHLVAGLPLLALHLGVKIESRHSRRFDQRTDLAEQIDHPGLPHLAHRDRRRE